MVLELGGATVELLYVGRNHSDNSIVMRFPKERALFAVDWIPVKSVGFRDWPDAYIEDWIESLLRLPKYESWGGYKDMFPLNVAGMYHHVQMHRRPN